MTAVVPAISAIATAPTGAERAKLRARSIDAFFMAILFIHLSKTMASERLRSQIPKKALRHMIFVCGRIAVVRNGPRLFTLALILFGHAAGGEGGAPLLGGKQGAALQR
jgi:hypothetical protein